MTSTDPRPVLVVDDNTDLLELMRYLLKRRGIETETATNGDEALEQLRSGVDPSLILLDLMMPVKDGFAFRREQLADPKLAHIPVIIFSGHYDVQEVGPQLKALACAQKGDNLADLADLVLKHCTELKGH
jgi:CheY-like chemotaxis protein